MPEPNTNTNTVTPVTGTNTVVPVVVPPVQEPAKAPEAPPATPNLPKTQEEMNAIIQERVARAKASEHESTLKDPAVVAAFNAQKALNDLTRAGMTEPEKIAADLKAAQDVAAQALKENAELKAFQLKQAALSKANLPLTFADRLHGSTEEEITTDIAALVAQLKELAAPQVTINSTVNPASSGTQSPTLDQQIDEALKKGDIKLAIRLKTLKASQTQSK